MADLLDERDGALALNLSGLEVLLCSLKALVAGHEYCVGRKMPPKAWAAVGKIAEYGPGLVLLLPLPKQPLKAIVVPLSMGYTNVVCVYTSREF